MWKTTGARLKDVIIVVPPFSTIGYPSLGASILVSGCKQIGIEAAALYANLLLAEIIGPARYEEICRTTFSELVGERIFSWYAYTQGQEPPEFSTNILRQSTAEAFLLHTVDRIIESGARIVGFSSTYQQTSAAVAIAKRLKATKPEIITVFGGPNASRPMGAALAEVTNAFDCVFSGEADDVFPAFCELHLAGNQIPPRKEIICSPIEILDHVAKPDFSDYVAALNELRAVCKDSMLADLPEFLPFETSRGCWWGEKNHCTFCGLNGEDMKYRRKSNERVLNELRELSSQFPGRRLHAADNIMPSEFPREVLRDVEKEGLGLNLFYEVKSNLKISDLDLLAASGVTQIQPGIESFSSNVLRLMRKGVKGIKNIWLLRECESRQIEVAWNLLFGIPGEKLQDYEDILAIVPLLEHLRPPLGLYPIVIDRYSPYFDDPAAFGISRLFPLLSYSLIYPAEAPLDRLAYHFTGEYATEFLEAKSLRTTLSDAIISWQRSWIDPTEAPSLFGISLDDGRMLVEDTRACATERNHILAKSEAIALRTFDKWRPSSFDQVSDAEKTGLVLRKLVLEHEGQLMSVVTDPTKIVSHTGHPAASIQVE